MSEEYGITARIYDPLLFIAVNPVRKAVARELSVRKEDRILDLCCGTGNQMKLLSRKGFRDLHCLDLSESMLDMVEAKRAAMMTPAHPRTSS